jgi:hypothetical protein
MYLNLENNKNIIKNSKSNQVEKNAHKFMFDPILEITDYFLKVNKNRITGLIPFLIFFLN